MKITEDYLKAQGFGVAIGMFIRSFTNPNMMIHIRKTQDDESWQLSVFKEATQTYGTYEGNQQPDNNHQSFEGCVTDIEQIETAMKLCGIRIDWRERIPYFISRTKSTFKLYQNYEGKDIFTGFETVDYNTAMAEMKRRNKEFTIKIEE